MMATFSPFLKSHVKISDHIKMPVVSRSEPPRHENPCNASSSLPIQSVMSFLSYWMKIPRTNEKKTKIRLNVPVLRKKIPEKKKFCEKYMLSNYPSVQVSKEKIEQKTFSLTKCTGNRNYNYETIFDMVL